jgi:DnaJ-class molecular chaperone
MNHKRYNKHLKRLISLKEGEEFCSECNGEGVIISKRIFTPSKKTHLLICKTCIGDGKVDWVEKATGKRKKEHDL